MTRPAIRALRRAMLTVAGGALVSTGAPFAAQAQDRSYAVAREIADRAEDLRGFYAARDYRPLWVSASGQATPAVAALLDRVESAELDALDRRTLRRLETRRVRQALRRAGGGDIDEIARADTEISRLFVRYVNAMQAVPSREMIYPEGGLAPQVMPAERVLASAATAPSLESHVRTMGWMHPLYAPLRDAMMAQGYAPAQRESIWRNMERLRAIPAMPRGRHVLVDTAGARLWMYEDGEVVDSMRVVVGKAVTQTPTMAGYLRTAIINPYWNIPVDLVQQNIATNVLDRGLGYLRERGYEVLSDYSDNPAVVDPKTVNWQEVANGTRFVRVRQKPGGYNFMGKAKFEFPNDLGIYLHDTPDKHLLKEEIRHLSAGCVRLEDYDRFGRWLLGEPLPRPGRQAEQRIAIGEAVPIYITHLTAMPDEGRIAFLPEVYRGGMQLAATAY